MRRKSHNLYRRKIFIFALYGVIFIVLAAGMTLIVMARSLPDPYSLGSQSVTQSTKIYDRTGTTLLYEIHGEERRTVIPFDQIPQVVKQATLAAEDSSFYQEPAFNLRAIARAAYHDIFDRQNGGLQGGSTITQQLVKNAYLTPNRTVIRKIKELILAIEFEKRYPKDQILGFYLNQIPYGSNAYGVEAASQTYFSKPAKDLDLAEAALLAGLPRAPSYYSPYGVHTDELKNLQDYILDRMVMLGYITKSQAAAAKKEHLDFAKQSYGIKAPHFSLEVSGMLEQKYGEDMLQTGGLNVVTTLDWNLQQIAEDAVKKGAAVNAVTWKASNAALEAEDPQTGQVLAMVGSKDYFDTADDGNVNIVNQLRQPGSSFKPFVYLTALEQGYTPDTVVFDVPTEFNSSCNPDGTPRDSSTKASECYHPQNYDGIFEGPLTFRRALAQSRNVPAVKVLYLVGVQNAINTAQNFGITTFTQPANYYGLPLVLGGGAVKLSEMLNGYSALAADGIQHPQTLILKVTDSSGNVLEDNTADLQQKRVADSKYVRVLDGMLSDDSARSPAFQLNGPLTISGWQAAAKTGTSQDFRDAWTYGFTPTLVAGVWVGNNDNRPMVKGSEAVMASAPIWHDFMTRALANTSPVDFPSPDTIASEKPMLNGQAEIVENAKIDSRSGQLSNANTPAQYIVERQQPQMHDILYYVDRNDPEGPAPQNPAADPQFSDWEAGVESWARNNVAQWDQFNKISGAPYSPPVPTETSISLLSPTPSSQVSGQELDLSIKVDPGSKTISEVAFLFNDAQITTFPPSSDNLYNLYFIPSSWQHQNKLAVQVKDDSGKITEQDFTIYH